MKLFNKILNHRECTESTEKLIHKKFSVFVVVKLF